MLVFANQMRGKEICKEEKLLVFTECYCPNGHNLVSENAQFDEFKGIFLSISNEEKVGQIALSPVYGCKTKVSVGIKLKEGNQYQ